MGRPTIVLDDRLVDACRKVTGIRTRSALVHHALSELLRRERLKRIMELKGSVRWDGNPQGWRTGRV